MSTSSSTSPPSGSPSGSPPSGSRTALGVVAWLWVLVPFAWGLVQLVGKIPALFGS